MEEPWESEGVGGPSQPHTSGKVSTMLVVAVLSLLFFTLGAYATVGAVQKDEESKRAALESARLIASQSIAVWEASGYAAATSVAERLSQETGVHVHVLDLRPGSTESCDAFEDAALESIRTGTEEYHGLAAFEGALSYRYVRVVTKFACAISVVVPLTGYMENHAQAFMSYGGLFVVLAIELVACIVVALRKLVSRPLEQLSRAAQEVGEGDLGGKLGSGIAFGEIAALKQSLDDMEARLKESHEQLEQRVRERTAELECANARLKDEVEYKTTFLSTMSHELRTPLAAIGAYADVWFRSPEARSAEDVRLLEGIKRSAKSLLGTINDTLDAASIEAKRFTLNPVETDLLDVVNAVDSVAEPLAEEKGVQWGLTVDEDVPLVVVDPNVIHKIAMNLVGNAIKFTNEGGSVHLEMRVLEAEGEIRLSVSDTGIGIHQDDLETIFERFRQADSSISRKYGGSGLGLSLVRELAELMGGSVTVTSAPGCGSEFVVRLPYAKCEEDLDESHVG